jgi:hypothetical protein
MFSLLQTCQCLTHCPDNKVLSTNTHVTFLVTEIEIQFQVAQEKPYN